MLTSNVNVIERQEMYKYFDSHLTQRGNKVFVGTQGLHAAFVLVVPDPKGFVISTAHYEPSSRMEQNPSHPVVMSNLKKD